MQNLNQTPSETFLLMLLEAGIISLNPEEPFTWNSGLKSPIYVDNRETLSLPVLRTAIKKSFVTLVPHFFPEVEVIAGVATGAIAHAALAADELNLPMVYVRSEQKAHGKGKLVEGKSTKDKKVVVIEDLNSTGGSSIRAIDALREEGANVLGLGAIFTYNFQKAINAFEKAKCPWFTLGDYPNLLKVAVKNNYIKAEHQEALIEWYKNPEVWKGVGVPA